MVFSSSIFLLGFFPLYFLIYYLLPSRRIKNIFALIASLFFYGYGEPIFSLLMLFSIVLNYIVGLLLLKYKDKKRTILTFGVICNLSLFFIFKYLDFAIVNINNILGTSIPLQKIPLPIGISFFTFQAMSYVFDVYYEGEGTVQKNPFKLGLYISLFPQLIAGPIVKYSDIKYDLDNRTLKIDEIVEGFEDFVIGLVRKVFISNNLAIIADYAFSNSNEFSLAALGSFTYLLQIYFDFSGYSMMAIGLGKMMGFHFPLNFNYPLLAKSVTDFWRRWHISLSSWFRDYVYIPLGGSRRGFSRTILNLLIIWLLTGVWHGANWTFVIWGLIHFTLVAMEKFYTHLTGKKVDNLPRWFTLIYILITMSFAFTWFRAESIESAIDYFKNYSRFNRDGISATLFFIKNFWIYYAAGIITAYGGFKKLLGGSKVLKPIFISLAFILCLIFIVKGGYNPFIYFNF